MNTNSMTHHITGDLFQRMTAEHSFPVLVRTAKQQSHLWSLMGTRCSEFIMKAAGQTLGQGGVLSEHPRTQFLLPDNLSVYVSMK